MNGSTIENKLTVFISSKIDDRYMIVRKALKKMLTETGMVASVYAFETEGASSMDLKSAYLNRVDQSDVCVFLIDNDDNVTDAVMAEHKRAKNANLHRLYFFCDEKNKTPTSLQNELMSSMEVKYKDNISKFSDFTTVVYESILQDIVDCYIYKRHKTIINPTSQSSTSDTIPLNTITLNKNVYKNYELNDELTKIFNPFDFNARIGINKDQDGYDSLCSVFLSTVLGRVSFDQEKFQQLKIKIQNDQQESIKDIIEARLDAVNHYFMGNLGDCVKKIKEAYNMAKIGTNIPQWLLNDIVIDIRNVNIMDGTLKNGFSFDTSASKILQDNPETVYYPLLDRFAEKSSAKMLAEFFEKHTESPYTLRSVTLNQFFVDISSYFNISIRFGSLSYILLTQKRYSDILFTLYVGGNDIRLFVELIKMYLLLKNNKQLKSITDTYKQSTSAITAMDVNVLIESNNTIPFENNRSIAHCLLLKYFGYYFNDEQYANQINLFFNYAFACCADKNKIEVNGYIIIKTLRSNIRRINNQKAVELIICFFENHIGMFYTEILQTACYLDFTSIENEQHIRLFENYITLMKEDNFIDKDVLQRAVLSLRQNSNKDMQETIDRNVELHMPEFFCGYYDLIINKHNSISHITDYLNVARQRNRDACDKNYSFHNCDPYEIISEIIKINFIELSTYQISEIMNVIKDTLINRAQQANDKISAILLVIFLKDIFPDFPLWNEFNKEINEKDKDVLSATTDPFFRTSSLNALSFNVLLMKICFKTCTYDEAAISFASATSFIESDFITISNNLYSFLAAITLSDINSNILGIIVNFILSIGSERHKDAQYFAAKSLVLLSRDTIYGPIVSERLAYLMEVVTSEIKLSILDSIKNKTLQNSTIRDYILQKGRTDNHYLVRKLAEEITSSTII